MNRTKLAKNILNSASLKGKKSDKTKERTLNKNIHSHCNDFNGDAKVVTAVYASRLVHNIHIWTFSPTSLVVPISSPTYPPRKRLPDTIFTPTSVEQHLQHHSALTLTLCHGRLLFFYITIFVTNYY